MVKLTEERRLARRRQVTEAAINCFARDGFHRTSMADIVRESGMSPGAIYHYFASKEDVIEAIAIDRHDREAEINRSTLADPDPVRALTALVRSYGSWLADPAEKMRRRVGVQVWAEALCSAKVHTLVLDGTDAARDTVARLLERTREQGRLYPGARTEALARVFVALFQGFILQMSWDEEADLSGYLAEVERVLSLLTAASAEGPGH
jgi:AcrR family transcriptional regulator